MKDSTNIRAVTVNHNSSLFAELMLRSLLATHGPVPRISLTVMDSASSDTDDFRALLEVAASHGIPVEQSGFDSNRAHPGDINTHGEILRSFVLDHPDCTHYLFLDPDVYFMAPDTVGTMLAELEADPTAFAVVARFMGMNKKEVPMPSGNSRTGELFTFSQTIRYADGREIPIGVFAAELKERIHPFCALLHNTPLFQTIVREIGLSNAFVKAEKCGVFYDTLGLLTAVMKTHGLTYIASSAMVLHFFNVTYEKQWLENKRQYCRELLQPLRNNGHGKENPGPKNP